MLKDIVKSSGIGLMSGSKDREKEMEGIKEKEDGMGEKEEVMKRGREEKGRRGE